jgi:hypothetical protein
MDNGGTRNPVTKFAWRWHSERVQRPAHGTLDAVEDGFTLIELLIVVVLVPFVIGAVAIVLTTALKDQTGVAGRLNDSHDAQITSAYFVRDVQGASGTVSTLPATILCSPSSAAGKLQPMTGTVQVLGLQWTPTGSSTVTSVSYNYGKVGATSVLERDYCPGGTPTSTPDARSIVAHGLSAQPTSVVCLVTGGCQPPGTQNSWTPGTLVKSAQIMVPDTSSNFSYSLLASPRRTTTFTKGPNQNPPTASLILLGGGGSCPQTLLTIGNNGGLTVGINIGSGGMAVDSSCSSSIAQSNNSSLDTTTIYTEASPPGSSNNNYPGTCTNCTDTGGYYYTPQGVTDPYSAQGSRPLSAPTIPGQGVCTGTADNQSCTAGLYSTTLNNCPAWGNGNSPTVTFAAGESVFDTCVLNMPPNADLEATGGSFFYFKNNAQLQTGSNPTVNITAPTQAQDPTYYGVGIFEERHAGETPWAWGGGNGHNGTLTINGSVYLPNNSLTINNVATFTVTQVICQSLTINNVGTTTIG